MAHPLDSKLSELIQHAYDNAPAFKQRMAASNLSPSDITSVDELQKLPPISKDDLVKLQAENPPFGGMLTIPITDLKWIFFSPGPLYEGIQDEKAALASTVSVLKASGVTSDDVILNTLSYHLVPFGIQFDRGGRELGATVLPTGVGNTDLQVKMLMDFRASVYVGTPSFLMALINKAQEFGVDPATMFPIKKAIVTAEPLPPSLRATFNEVGIRVTNIFGTAELGALGYEPDDQPGFVLLDDKLVQICDPETGESLPHGEIGEIVATNFNSAYPIIRLGTGDLSRIQTDPLRLMGWLGRSGQGVKVRGMFVYPMQLGSVMARFSHVTGFYGIVDRKADRDDFTVQITVDDSVEDQESLVSAIMEAIPSMCRVSADAVIVMEKLDGDANTIQDIRTWE